MYDGAKGSIYRLIIKLTNTATQMDELRTGAIDMLQGISGGDRSPAVSTSTTQASSTHLLPALRLRQDRFACDFRPTQFDAVRRAIAYSLDRNEFARQYRRLRHHRQRLLRRLDVGVCENKDVLDRELNAYQTTCRRPRRS